MIDVNQMINDLSKMSGILEDFLHTIQGDLNVDPERLVGAVQHAKLSELATLQTRLADLHDRAHQVKSQIGRTYDWVRMNAVPEKCEEENVTTTTIPGVGRLSLTSDVNVKVLNKASEYEWLEAIGEGSVISETVNASTLKALIRRRLRDGEEIPQDIFEVSPVTRAVITKV